MRKNGIFQTLATHALSLAPIGRRAVARLAAVVVMAAALAVTASAQAGKPWVTFRGPDGDFSASMPAEPRHAAEQSGLDPSGQPLEVFSLAEGGVAYVITYNDLARPMTPAETDFLIAGVVRGLKDNGHGVLESERVSDREARIVSSFEIKGVRYLSRTRMVTRGRRTYSAMVSYPAERAEVRDAERFLASLAFGPRPFRAGTSTGWYHFAPVGAGIEVSFPLQPRCNPGLSGPTAIGRRDVYEAADGQHLFQLQVTKLDAPMGAADRERFVSGMTEFYRSVGWEVVRRSPTAAGVATG